MQDKAEPPKIGTAASGRRHPVAPFSWKTLRWDCFKKTRSSHARLNVPALVQVAAFAIILIRGLDLLMILNLLGLQRAERIHTPQRSDLEPDAGLSRQSGAGVYRNLVRLLAGERAQLGALDLSADADYRCRLPVGGIAGLRVSGAVQHSRESKREIFHSLVMQKLPDLLVLTLLFVPANCRRFFRLQ